MDIQDHLSVDNMKLNNKELKQIVAGKGLTGTLINSLTKGFDSFLDIGRYFGSSLRRIIGGNLCNLK